MITWLIWTIWILISSVPKKADKLNLSLSLIIFHARATHTLTIFELYLWNQSQIYGISYDNLFWYNIDFARNWAGFTTYGMQTVYNYTELMNRLQWSKVPHRKHQITEQNLSFPLRANSWWCNDVTWRYRSGSTLAQVMAWCLIAPSHYLNQWWLIIQAFGGIHLLAVSKGGLMNMICNICVNITLSKLLPHPPGANELIALSRGWRPCMSGHTCMALPTKSYTTVFIFSHLTYRSQNKMTHIFQMTFWNTLSLLNYSILTQISMWFVPESLIYNILIFIQVRLGTEQITRLY